MTFIDWTIIAVFLIGLTLIGFLFSKSNRNLEDYFLGGRSMPTWLVAFAATGTSISAGTFVGSPELGFNTNLTYLMLCVGAILGGTLVALLVLPKLYNANTITIYGYLGDRFGDSAKNSSSVMFLVGQLFTSGSRLFIAAIAVSVILYGSIQFEFLMYSIIILGVVSTVYTMAGGIKGLIYIDTIQIMLVIGTGVVALLFIYFSMTPHMSLGDIFATLASGEVKNAAGEWVAGNKLQIVDASWRMDVPYNLMGALVGCTIFKFAQFSTDHEFVQRQLTCKSVKKAGVSLVYSQILSLPIVLISCSTRTTRATSSRSTSAARSRRACGALWSSACWPPRCRVSTRRSTPWPAASSPTSTCRCASVWDMRSRRTATRCRRRRKWWCSWGPCSPVLRSSRPSCRRRAG